MPVYYPLFLDLSDRLCVVVGGGNVAAEKVDGLLDAGARVRLIALRLVPALAARVAESSLEHRPRGYRRGDLAGALLVLSERISPRADRALWAEAQARGIPINVQDDTAHCSFIAPAIVRRGDLQVAVSTSGQAPVLAVRLRQWLERRLGPQHARFLALAGDLRARVAARHPDFAHRRRLWYKLVDSDVLPLLERGQATAARARAEELLELAPMHRAPAREAAS